MPSEVFMVISYYGTGLDASSIAVFCLLVCLVQSVQFPLKKNDSNNNKIELFMTGVMWRFPSVLKKTC